METISEVDEVAVTTDDGWDMVCEAGRLARLNMDDGRWIIGDLALQVDKSYGKDKIAAFAREINVERARVKEYRTVAKFYKDLPGQTFQRERPTLTYSHLRDAMRLKELDKAVDFLDEAAANTWTVEETRIKLTERLGKPVPPPRILDGAPCRIVAPQGARQVIFEFTSDDDARKLRELYFRKETAVEMTLEAAS